MGILLYVYGGPMVGVSGHRTPKAASPPKIAQKATITIDHAAFFKEPIRPKTGQIYERMISYLLVKFEGNLLSGIC